jgi:hypothetical protein
VCVPFIINQTPVAGGDHCHGPQRTALSGLWAIPSTESGPQPLLVTYNLSSLALSPGRPVPPRSATPASVLKAHKLVGGATRVVMLKHRDNAPRSAVSFGGKLVSTVAMLVGGRLELPLPLYCVDDVSKALVDLRPEGAPAIKTANFQHTHLTTRAVHDLLRDGARQ